jgi:hypothetical protein
MRGLALLLLAVVLHRVQHVLEVRSSRHGAGSCWVVARRGDMGGAAGASE